MVVSDGTCKIWRVLLWAVLAMLFSVHTNCAAIPHTFAQVTAHAQYHYLAPVAAPVGPATLYLSPQLKKKIVVKARYELNRPIRTGEAGIILVLQFNKQRTRCMTGEYVLPDHWDKKRHRVADRYLDQFPDYLETNRVLDDLDQLLRRNYNQHRRALTLDQFTPDVIKSLVAERVRGVTPTSEAQTILAYYKRNLDERARSGNLSASTLNGERSTYRHFERFDAEQPRRFVFADASLSLFERFRDYLWAAGVNADSSVHKNLRRFRQVLLHAEASGIETGGAIKSISLKSQLGLSSQAMDTIALNEDDLQTLADLPLLGRLHLRRARDLFLCGCYTGLRVNQWGEISKDNLIEQDGVKMLQLFTTKGRRRSITIPVHPVLLSIFEYHDYILPPVPPPHRLNKYLKELCRVAGFTDTVELARNVRGRSVLQTFERWELVTSHTARRSFATNAHAAGLPLDDIQALTGHADRKTLEHYIKEDGRHRAARLSRSGWFSDKNS